MSYMVGGYVAVCLEVFNTYGSKQRHGSTGLNGRREQGHQLCIGSGTYITVWQVKRCFSSPLDLVAYWWRAPWRFFVYLKQTASVCMDPSGD